MGDSLLKGLTPELEELRSLGIGFVPEKVSMCQVSRLPWRLFLLLLCALPCMRSHHEILCEKPSPEADEDDMLPDLPNLELNKPLFFIIF